MQCLEFAEAYVSSLAGEASPLAKKELDQHVAACARCAADASKLDGAWNLLGEDASEPPSAGYLDRTARLLAAETLRRRVVHFAQRPRFLPMLLRVAALLAAASGGYLAAHLRTVSPAARPAVVASSDAGGSGLPDLSAKPRLTNVSYQPADASGRIGVSFDLTRRYSVAGTPEDRQVGSLLAYLMSSANTEGGRGQAIDLVSRHYGENSSPSSPVVDALVQSLQSDRNPGVRKKAAEALTQFPPTPKIRDAFLAALKSDGNPGIRILAVEGLSRAAAAMRDPAAIETLREKASDSQENGYVRVKAASALKRIDL